MSNKKKDRSHKKHTPKIPSHILMGQKIAKLSQKVSTGYASEEDDDKLDDMIQDCLDLGHDNALFQALEEVDSFDDYDDLEYLIMGAAETDFIELEKHAVETLLFAIPILLVALPGSPYPEKIDVDVCSLLKKHGVVGDEPFLYLNDEFLHLDDVNLFPSKRRELLRNLYEETTVRHVPIKSNDDEFNLILRFVVGYAMSELDDDETPFLPNDKDQYQLLLDNWRAEMQDLLIKQLGNETVIVGDPNGLNDTITQGNHLLNDLGLKIKTSSLSEKVVSYFVEPTKNDLIIHFLDKDDMDFDTYPWEKMPSDDLDFISDVIQSIFSKHGINKLVFLEDIYGEDFLDDIDD